MPLSPLTAISPLDGRYHKKTLALSEYFSEYGLMRRRLQAEIQWLKILAASEEIPSVAPLDGNMEKRLDDISDRFDTEQAERVKAIESDINHDVKAIEEYLREKIKAVPELASYSPFIHIACTSEDINSIAYALMVKDARDNIIVPALDDLAGTLQALALEYAELPLLSRTHGQAASPTTVGKEFANFCFRIRAHLHCIKSVPITAKWNGAVGNYNAHHCAWPDADWIAMSEKMMGSLGLQASIYTTQIEPHERLAELLDALARASHTLVDFCRDMWAYISRGVLIQKANRQEVGSSTMPHKVNPIDFENAEGNLGIAATLARHLADKLVISRWQRDLSDSTVMRSLGSVFAHTVLGLDGIIKGCDKIAPDRRFIAAELAAHPEVLTEAIQTILRKHGVEDAYDQLKSLSRGQELGEKQLQTFIEKLDLPTDEKRALLELRSETYTGIAAKLAREIKSRLK